MSAAAPGTVRVWDRLVRATHWSVAACVVVDLLNEAGANPWHRYIGYAAAGLVAVRLAWGAIGAPHVRVSAIAATAARLPSYLRQPRGERFVAHNPLGAAMAIALWTTIVGVCVTGWMLQLDAYWGDDAMQAVHSSAAYALAAMAVLHVGGVVATSIAQRTNLMRAMITGRKPRPDPRSATPRNV